VFEFKVKMIATQVPNNFISILYHLSVDIPPGTGTQYNMTSHNTCLPTVIADTCQLQMLTVLYSSAFYLFFYIKSLDVLNRKAEILNIKVKVTPEQATKTHYGSRLISLYFL